MDLDDFAPASRSLQFSGATSKDGPPVCGSNIPSVGFAGPSYSIASGMPSPDTFRTKETNISNWLSALSIESMK
jgi:hypothetical protein